jgi:uncharacterized integral membrane protein
MEEPGKPLNKIKKGLLVFCVLLLFVVILQNSHTVSLQFLFWRIQMPGIFFYPLLFLIGLAAGWIGCLIFMKRHRDEASY